MIELRLFLFQLDIHDRDGVNYMAKLSALLIALAVCLISTFLLVLPAAAQGGAQVSILKRDGTPTSKITDGDSVILRVELPEKAAEAMTVVFGLDDPAAGITRCKIPQGSSRCDTDLVSTLGWHWSGGAPVENRSVYASTADSSPSGGEVLDSISLQVAARPVVMVHGFVSSWDAWKNYLGPDGYLASTGVPGFAVGDGQVDGVLNTGDIKNPAGRTNTLAQNAAILGEYIRNVKKLTGAEQVDLVAHSMGGMISRYYIDRVMKERDVAQLIMLGSPAAGTDCANLPAALGFYLPATLEIRPSYGIEILNRQIIHRKGVPFYALAGNPIVNPVGSPCSSVPSDIVISRQSVSAIPLHLSEIPLLHVDLNLSQQVFEEFVLPLLKKGPGEYPDEPDPVLEGAAAAPLQFTRVFTGHVSPGESQELTIHIDPNVTVASFALYDPSLSFDVTVRGASGKVIDLDPAKNGLIVVNDPRSLVQLGYGFANPKPGAWLVTLKAKEGIAAEGADYALTAQFTGGAVLQGATSSMIPKVGEPVEITAALELGGQPLPVEQAEAVVRAPDGSLQKLQLSLSGDRYQTTWRPSSPGLYAIDLRVQGESIDSSPVERTAFLSVEAQPASDQVRTIVSLIGVVVVALGIVILGIGMVVWLVRRGRSARQGRHSRQP